MVNFQPVSNLSFMSKVVEKAVSRQLNEYLIDQGLMSRHRSAYRKKTILLRRPCYESCRMP